MGVSTSTLTDLVEDLPLAGYGQRAFFSNTGIADPVNAKALVLDNGGNRVAIVTADILLFNRVLSSAVLARLQEKDSSWTRQRVYFGATHTHSGPGGYAGAAAEQVSLGLFRPDVTERLANRIAETVIRAAEEMHPSEFLSASLEVDEKLVRNRTVATDPANRWLDLLTFREPGSRRTQATVIVFSAHATSLPTSDRRISGDYPGTLTRALASQTGGVVLFLAGAVGSMAPPDALWPKETRTENLGKRLAEDAASLLRGRDEYRREVPLRADGFLVSLPAPQVKLGKHLRLSPLAASMLLPPTAWLHALRIGDTLLLGTPCDYSGVLALELRKKVPDTTAIVTSFNGDYVGYLLPDGYDDLPKYEPRSMSLFGRHAGSTFQEKLVQVAERLAR
ncbi:MAG: neutral/alkaline non-lysosomal ceramidase N-terminal domain-containing protein [Planctomycetota bacterium]